MDTFSTHRLQVLCLFVTLGICLSRTGVSAQRLSQSPAPAPEKIAAQNECTILRPKPVEVKQEEEFKIDGESVVMCSKGACEKLSLKDIKTAYPDSFSSQQDAEKRTGLNYNAYVEKYSACRFCFHRFRSDYDRCCPTWRYVTFYNGRLRDVTNRWCYIVQIPFLRLYQYMSVGLCGPKNRCKTCVQKYTIQSLLAWCPGSSGIGIRHFRIPTYCSCQSSLMCIPINSLEDSRC